MTMPQNPSGRTFPDPELGQESDTTLLTEESEVGDQAPDKDAGRTTRSQMREVKEQVVAQTRTSIRQARDRAVDSLSESRRRAADQIGSLATAFHRTSEHLRSEQQTSVAGLADSLARRVDGVSAYLRDTEMGTMVDDLESLARRKPAAVLGVGLVLGIFGARFLKSSGRGGTEAGGFNARA